MYHPASSIGTIVAFESVPKRFANRYSLRKSCFKIWKSDKLFIYLKLRIEDTFARKNKEKWIFLWFFAHLFVSLPTETILLRPKTTFPCHIHDALDINRL